MFEFDYTLDASLANAGNRMIKKYMIALYIILPIVISFEYFFNFFKTKDYYQLLLAFLSIFIFFTLIFIVSKIRKNTFNVNSKFLDQKVNIVFSDTNISVKTKKEGSFEEPRLFKATISFHSDFEQVLKFFQLLTTVFAIRLFNSGVFSNCGQLIFVSR